MKRALILLLVGLFLVAVLLFIFNPQVLEEVWLWIIGLIGPIVAFFKRIGDWISGLFKNEKAKIPEENKNAASIPVGTNSSAETGVLKEEIKKLSEEVELLESQLKAQHKLDEFEGTTLTVLRYLDDGETTLGMLFIDNNYYCYTLEDTKRDVKIKGKTRIPSGTYALGLNEYDTDLTKLYRKTRDWFTYHLHVKNVPDFTGIYIHNGSNHVHTKGCLLVADSINASNAKKAIYNSRVTFERLYKQLKPQLDDQVPMRIRYYDEDWFAQSKLSNQMQVS